MKTYTREETELILRQIKSEAEEEAIGKESPAQDALLNEWLELKIIARLLLMGYHSSLTNKLDELLRRARRDEKTLEFVRKVMKEVEEVA